MGQPEVSGLIGYLATKKMMKKVLIFLLFAATSAFSQTVELNDKTLVGKWLFNDIVAEGKDNGISLKERKEMLEGVYLLFKDDKTCVTSFIMDREGTWSLDATTKVITVKEGMKTNTWTVHSFTGKEIVLSRNEALQKILFKRQ